MNNLIHNNYIERFHGIINQALKCYHPKISYLITKYKEYTIKVYNKITSSLVNKIEIKKEKSSNIKDIKQFFIKYNKKSTILCMEMKILMILL